MRPFGEKLYCLLTLMPKPAISVAEALPLSPEMTIGTLPLRAATGVETLPPPRATGCGTLPLPPSVGTTVLPAGAMKSRPI